MKRTGIPIPGFRFDKNGNLVRDVRKLDVSTRLKRAAKQKVRYKRGSK